MTFLAMSRAISLYSQRDALASFFPSSSHWIGGNQLLWRNRMQPSSLSDFYEVVIQYSLKSIPNIFVLSPQLSLAKGAVSLPHVYDSKLQKLCLFHPQQQRWKSSYLLANTVVPWALEWLLHYEIWVGTNEWHGGGIEHEKAPQD